MPSHLGEEEILSCNKFPLTEKIEATRKEILHALYHHLTANLCLCPYLCSFLLEGTERLHYQLKYMATPFTQLLKTNIPSSSSFAPSFIPHI